MSQRRKSEHGYALLFVFALSAAMAMMLYLELPRLALEMQRNREELLIERGEQYVRAIKVFTKKNKKWPQTVEELESFNGVRFLRRRYVDPLTGKDEWRLIHADASGRLTDSLVQKAVDPTQDPTRSNQQSVNNFVTEGPSFGATGDAGGGRVAQALNRRASEQPGAPGAPPIPGQPSNYNSSDPLVQQQMQQQQFQQGAPPVPVVGPNGQIIQRVPGLPGQFGQPYPPQAANSQTGGVVPQPNYSAGSSFGSGYSGSATPPPPPGPQPAQGYQQGAAVPGGFRPGGGSASFGGPIPGQPVPGAGGVNPATQMIQQILTRPNPQGLANIQGAAAGGGMGSGIAGVASKVDAEGIKIYKDKTNYKEWEFVFDPAKEMKNAQGQIPGQIPGQSPGQIPGGFGGQPGGLGGQPGGLGGLPTTRR